MNFKHFFCRCSCLVLVLVLFSVSVKKKAFERLRAGALVATTAAAPETCALYLGGELWGTGASEGTKLEVRSIKVH